MAKDSLFVGAMNEAPIKGDSRKPSGNCIYDGEAGMKGRTKSPNAQTEVNRVLGSRLPKPTRKG